MSRKVNKGIAAALTAVALCSTSSATLESNLEQRIGAASSRKSVDNMMPIRSAKPSNLRPAKGTLPFRLVIDPIGIDAEISPVGVDPYGEFQIPSADQVGWYKYGAVPGAEGSTVLAGHVDYNGRKAVFFNLDRLKQGDKFVITLYNSEVRTFKVAQIKQYHKSTLPLTQLFSKDKPQTLHLITCGGEFDQRTRSYLDNLVVTAYPETKETEF
jgi:LPXTG-site transpeptidase (sortase) family protein